MTIGRNSEAPAAYALTSTIKRLLDHLSEANLYSAKDLNGMNKTLERLEGMVSKSGHNSSPYLTELLGKRVELCKSRIADLQRRLDRLSEPLQEIHEKLISILRSMSLANTKAKVCTHIRRARFIGLNPENADVCVMFTVLLLRSPEATGAAEGYRRA